MGHVQSVSPLEKRHLFRIGRGRAAEMRSVQPTEPGAPRYLRCQKQFSFQFVTGLRLHQLKIQTY